MKKRTLEIISFLQIFILISIQFLAFKYIGYEILLFLINTGSYYIIAIVFLINLQIILYILNIFSLIKTGFSFFSFFKPSYEKLVMILTLCLCFALLTAEIIYFDLLPISKTPAAPQNLIYTTEPFLQLSPESNGKMKSASGNLTIWWFSSDSKNYVFKYGKTPEEKFMSQADIKTNDQKRFQVDLTELEPSQKYYYKIAGLSEKIYNFKTAPEENSQEEIRILSMGDMRTGRNRVFSFYKEVNSAADSVYKNSGLPSFKLNTGDIIHNGHDYYSWEFFLDIEKIHSPYIPNAISIGNHELYNDSGANYDYLINLPRYYSFSWGMVHVIILNSYDGIFNTAGAKQYQFLKSELEKYSGKKWIIVQQHVPIISTGDYNMNRLMIAQFFELFRKFKVDLVITGHDHHFDSFLVDAEENWGGTFYIVNGGGGSKLDTTNMTRKDKKWKSWIHDRNSNNGLYQKDEITKKYHIYSESAWGFADIKINSYEMIIDYYRWLDIEKYLTISKQNIKKWNPQPLSAEIIKQEGLEKPQLIKTLKKKRTFQKNYIPN